MTVIETKCIECGHPITVNFPDPVPTADLRAVLHRYTCRGNSPHMYVVVGGSSVPRCEAAEPEVRAARADLAAEGAFRPDYDWTSVCPHEGDDACPDGDNGCHCECHAVSGGRDAEEGR